MLAAGLVYGWTTQSGYYAIWPDKAHPAAQYVHVPDGKAPAPDTGIYFVDVHLLEANRIEAQYFKHLVNGAQLIPVASARAPGREPAAVPGRRSARDGQLAAGRPSRRRAGIGDEGRDQAAGADRDLRRSALPGRQGGSPGRRGAAQGRRPPGALEPGPRAGHRPCRARATPPPTRSVDWAPARSKPSRAPGTKRGIIGIGIADAARITHLPVHVHFSTQNIGGPSAGLAFTLEIYDSLSGRHLLHGHRVAVTGEIGLDGSVQPIGGVTQKTLGAIDAGADTFIVPKGDNYRDARPRRRDEFASSVCRHFTPALRVIRHLPPVAPPAEKDLPLLAAFPFNEPWIRRDDPRTLSARRQSPTPGGLPTWHRKRAVLHVTTAISTKATCARYGSPSHVPRFARC